MLHYILVIAILNVFASVNADAIQQQPKLQGVDIPPAYAEINANSTLYSALFTSEDDFEKKCERLYNSTVSPFNSATLVVSQFMEQFKAQKENGTLPASLDFDIAVMDKNGDGSVSMEEFCSDLKEKLSGRQIKDFKENNFDAATLAQVKAVTCTWKDKIPFLKDDVCKAIEEAEEAQEKQEEQSTAVALAKRNVISGTFKGIIKIIGYLFIAGGIITVFFAIGFALLIFFHSLFAIPAVISLFLALIYYGIGHLMVKSVSDSSKKSNYND